MEREGGVEREGGGERVGERVLGKYDCGLIIKKPVKLTKTATR